jgi:hypothetical protein
MDPNFESLELFYSPSEVIDLYLCEGSEDKPSVEI